MAALRVLLLTLTRGDVVAGTVGREVWARWRAPASADGADVRGGADRTVSGVAAVAVRRIADDSLETVAAEPGGGTKGGGGRDGIGGGSAAGSSESSSAVGRAGGRAAVCAEDTREDGRTSVQEAANAAAPGVRERLGIDEGVAEEVWESFGSTPTERGLERGVVG